MTFKRSGFCTAVAPFVAIGIGSHWTCRYARARRQATVNEVLIDVKGWNARSSSGTGATIAVQMFSRAENLIRTRVMVITPGYIFDHTAQIGTVASARA